MDKQQLWKNILESVKVSISQAAFNTWFTQTHLIEANENQKRYFVKIGCPNSITRDTIENRYFGLLQDTLAKSFGKPCDIVFAIKESPYKSIAPKDLVTPLFQLEEGKDDFVSSIRGARLRINFTFENFAVSSSNQLAYAAAEAVAQNPGQAYNPLFFWGGVGVGKTHLMTAVGHRVLRRDPDLKVLVCSAEEFTNDIVEGIRYKTTPEVRKKYRKLNILLIDDIQFIAGKDTAQEEFFHTFNAVTSSGGQIILTSDRPPSEMTKLEDRLKSRFEAGLIVDIAPPDFELRCAILQIKSKEREIDLPMDLVQLIAGNIDSPRKLEGFLIGLISEVKTKRIGITEELISSRLGKGQESNGEKIKATPDQVIVAVSKYYSIGKRMLLGSSRQKPVATSRQILMYILRRDLELPLEEVGRVVDRDHTTVMHAVEKITHLASNNVQIREDLLGIKKLI